MNSDTRTYVVNLLENCQERQRKIALLHYELEHPAHISETEMIRTMALGHGDNSGSGHPEGRVSDKTLYIALNYRSKADKMNADTKEEIVVQLVELEEDQKRLEYYISLLREREASVLRMIYLNRLPLDEIASQIGIVLRTVRKIRERAIDELVKMYDFTGRNNPRAALGPL